MADEADILDPQEPQGKADAPVFTQDQLNAAAAAARREAASRFADYDELKAQAARAAELENEKLSEQERIQKALAKEQQRTAQLEGRIAETMISAEVKVRSALMGYIDPDAALALLDRSQISYSEDEGVTGVEDALITLLAAKPYLKGTAPHKPAPNLNGGPGKPGTAPTPLTEAQLAVAQRMRMTPEQYAKGLAEKS